MASRFVMAACMWGIAACVLVYRYAMLPLDWQSPMRHVLIGVAFGLAFGGQALWRTVRGAGTPRPRLFVLIAGAAAGAALAFGAMYLAFPTLDRAPLAKRQFPGFEMSMPEGELVQDSLDYTAGKLVLKVGGRRGVVAIQWEPGTEWTEDEITAMAKAVGAGLGDKIEGEPRVVTLPGGDGKLVSTIVFDGNSTFALSLLRCGIRDVVVAAVVHGNALRLQRRMVASFVCRADPARDATARVAIPLWLDLPGWYAVEREVDQIEISDGAAHLTLRTVIGSANVPLEKLLAAALSFAGANVTIGQREGDRIPLTFHEDGEEAHGWAQLFPCPRGTALVFGIATDRPGADALHERVTNAARCLREREPAQEWPDAPADESAAPDDATPADAVPAPASP